MVAKIHGLRDLDARRGSAYAFRDLDIRRGSAYVDPECDKFMELPLIISVGSTNDIATKCQCWQMSSGRTFYVGFFRNFMIIS